MFRPEQHRQKGSLWAMDLRSARSQLPSVCRVIKQGHEALERQMGGGETLLWLRKTTQDGRLGVEQEDGCGQVDGSHATISLSVSWRS